MAAGTAGHALVGFRRTSEIAALPFGLVGSSLATGTLRSFATGTNLPGPIVATNGSSTLAAWAADGALASQTFDGTFWGATATVTSTGLSYYKNATVAVNSKGQAVMAWRDSSAGAGDGYAGVAMASYWSGAAWSAPQLISLAGAARKAWWHACDLDEVGTAVCAWADFDPGGTYTRIWANILDFDTGTPVWRGPEPIDQDSPGVYLSDKPENGRDIHVVLEPQGHGGHVVWIQHGPGGDTTSRTWGNSLE